MASPRTDDFRIERRGDLLVVTFTPDGRSYSYEIGGTMEPSRKGAPRTGDSDYSDGEVEAAATKLAMNGGPRT